MSIPTEFEFAILKLGDGADPEVFSAICGLEDVSINEVVNTNDRFVRDCALPNRPPERKVTTTGRQTDITSSGLTNVLEVANVRAALGKSLNYTVEGYKDDGTDAGQLLGTYSGAFVMTSSNNNLTRENAGSAEITLASNGPVTFVAV